MSSRSLRRVLAGSLTTAFLVLSCPVSAQPAALCESHEASSLWVQAWSWLVAQISPAEEESAAESDSDAGWMLDPNG